MKKLSKSKLLFAAMLSVMALTVSSSTFAHQSDGGWQKHTISKGHVSKHKRDLYKKRHHRGARHEVRHHRYGYYDSPRVWERRHDHRHYQPRYGYVPNSGIGLYLFSEL